MTRLTLLTTNLARGGAETQVAQLAMALRRRGWDVQVIALLPPTAFTEELAAAGVPAISLDMRPGAPNPLGLFRLLRHLRRFRPRILHAHMFHANLMARAARLLYPVPVVVSTIHSLAETSRASASVRGRDLLYRVTDILSDATVCVSPAVAKRHLAARAISRVRVIPNGVDTSRFRPGAGGRARLREALGIGDRFAWLAAGRLMWKKDYPTLLRAMAKQPSGILLMAGEGPLEAELRGLAGANVRFLGGRADVPELMDACDGFALSSVIEGLPMVLLEAAAAGLPA
ncbi:MAG: glycosyltransferase, partial [Acidobacteriia bacterium]|nr:glycosyltransferase [Terriglobia bacterium]